MKKEKQVKKSKEDRAKIARNSARKLIELGKLILARKRNKNKNLNKESKNKNESRKRDCVLFKRNPERVNNPIEEQP